MSLSMYHRVTAGNDEPCACCSQSGLCEDGHEEDSGIMKRAPENQAARIRTAAHGLNRGKEHNCTAEQDHEAGQGQNRCHRRPAFYGIASRGLSKAAHPALTAREKR